MSDNSLENKILTIVKERNTSSDGHNGISFSFLSNLGMSSPKEIKDVLNRLYRSQRILIREGINEKIIFYNFNKDKDKD